LLATLHPQFAFEVIANGVDIPPSIKREQFWGGSAPRVCPRVRCVDAQSPSQACLRRDRMPGTGSEQDETAQFAAVFRTRNDRRRYFLREGGRHMNHSRCEVRSHPAARLTLYDQCAARVVLLRPDSMRSPQLKCEKPRYIADYPTPLVNGLKGML
jgi:hypothetical protein